MLTLNDTALLLHKRRYGERGVLITVFSQHHGKRMGFAHSWSKHASFQSGMQVQMHWRARHDQQLGSLTLEASDAAYQMLLHHAGAAFVIQILCDYINNLLPDYDPHPLLYHAFLQARHHLVDEIHPMKVLADFERILLTEMGFGCDVSCCAQTGQRDDLVYVSPKTGRAVSRAAGQPYHHRLFALPSFWQNDHHIPSVADIRASLAITGHFLDLCLLRPRGLSLPEVRQKVG